MIRLIYLLKHNYDNWFENKKSTDKEKLTEEKESVDLFDMPPLEGD